MTLGMTNRYGFIESSVELYPWWSGRGIGLEGLAYRERRITCCPPLLMLWCVMQQRISPGASLNGTIQGHLITPPHATQHPSAPSGLFYWDEDTAASKMHACGRYVPVRDVCLWDARLRDARL